MFRHRSKATEASEAARDPRQAISDSSFPKKRRESSRSTTCREKGRRKEQHVLPFRQFREHGNLPRRRGRSAQPPADRHHSGTPLAETFLVGSRQDSRRSQAGGKKTQQGCAESESCAGGKKWCLKEPQSTGSPASLVRHTGVTCVGEAQPTLPSSCNKYWTRSSEEGGGEGAAGRWPPRARTPTRRDERRVRVWTLLSLGCTYLTEWNENLLNERPIQP